MTAADSAAPLGLVVLISGRGSNFLAILKAIQAGELNAEIRAVVSSRGDAAGLEFARQAGIETAVLEHTTYPDREQYDTALADCIDRFQPGLVVLAGFMRILTAGFVRHYAGRLVNIHPSLLPRHRGLQTHARALEAGDREHGASVHLVTEELDGGPVLLQVKIPVLADDTPDSLAERVLKQEHRLYPEAIRRIAAGRLEWKQDQVILDGQQITTTPQLEPV